MLQNGPRPRACPGARCQCTLAGSGTDTAHTLCHALDLVLTVDTAMAHLAGALGVPVWLLNRHDSDWRWGNSGQDSVWYPSMRIFGNLAPAIGPAPLQEVQHALQALLQHAHHP